ncbi:beta strand repeat-containing protein [Aliarcobacter lanthieri]|uniref:beta strand repeat-containing protein n=1 Tax=Aliarcobacter lanthieri TaxID=1355374 RepID=UPI00047A4F69|nr:MBG domain-containing protein [Aliarcobacter lanthieri]
MYQNHEYKNRFRILKGGLISLVVASNLYSAPSGGTVVSGNATINQNGNTTNINQSSQKASINWQDFSISKNETVNFNQPNTNSITLNRVIGNEKSIIDGALNANGQVWILNSNGTLFGKNAKVNTSGLLVTTKELSDDDFQKGNYSFKGNSKESIENQGDINLNDKAYTVFVANSVINNGEIKVHKGTVHLTGADEFSLTLNENQNISLKVTKGALNSLVENNNLIVANGGNVYLTTNAKNELLKGVVNNTGIIEAASLDDLQSEVILFAHGGTANIDGEIKAKNSFVETSGENISVKDSFKITANKWLLDPVDMTIEANGGSDFNSGSVSATAIQNALAGTNLELQADNNITVNQNITWSTDKQLKLTANSIDVNATINNTNSTNGGVYFNASNTTYKVVFGTNGKVIVNNINQMQWIETALNGKYELGSNIDAGATKTDTAKWGTTGFNPIGNDTNIFTGTFDGKGFTISNLYINRPTQDYVGLFGITNNPTIKNIGLENLSIVGKDSVGGLVGNHLYGTISNSYASGTVSGGSKVGGLLGENSNGTIENSYASGTVSGGSKVGGLLGYNTFGTILNSYASGTVSGGSKVGGLLGVTFRGTILNSYASGTVSVGSKVGGLLGYNTYGTIENSYYDNATNTASMNDSSYGKTKIEIATALKNVSSEWETDLSKGRGYGTSGTTDLPFLKNVTKLSNTLFEDGHGTITNPYTITNWTQLQNINNSKILTSGYYFNLLNNIDSSTAGYMGNSGEGWIPIGDVNSQFRGTFDGQGNTISNLYINRLNSIGLFGESGSVSTIRNIGLKDVNIRGQMFVGALVGTNDGTITNSYASGAVNGVFSHVGGLVGENYGTISNSYASVSVGGTSSLGGLVGFNYQTITNSFYDKTKFNGNGVGDDLYFTGVKGLTTEEMKHGTVYKTAGWDIVADSTLVEGTPVIKFDSANNKYVWAIAPKTFTANLSNQSTTYNGLLQNLSSIYTSQSIFGTAGVNFKFVDVDNNDITAYKNAGTYSNIGVVSLDEFIVAGVGTKGTLTINKANLDIIANSNSLVYNGQTQSVNGYTFGTNGLLGSDTKADLVGLTGITTTSSSKNVGNYATNIGGTSNNYNINFTQGNLSITKANAIVNANSNSVVYNGLTQNVNGFTVSGLVGGETKDVLTGLTGLTTSGKNAGEYNTNLAGDDINYNLTFNQGKLTITKANAIVNANSNSVVYNGLTQNVNGFTVSGLVNNETKDVLTGLTDLITSGKNAGEYNTNLAGDDINYNLTFNQGKLTIAKANLDIVANSNSLVYNGKTQSVNGYIFGENKLLGSDTVADLNLSGITTISSSKNVGTTKTNISGISDNYNINVAQGTLNIIKKGISVTADNKNKKQGENNPNLTYVANGLIENDTLNGTLSTNATQNSEVGSYDIEKGSLDNPNYEIDFKKGKLIVEAKTELPKPETPRGVQEVVDSISHQIAQTLQVESQIDNQILNINQNTQTVSFNKRYGVEIINGGINAPTKEEEARNFQNMINK